MAESQSITITADDLASPRVDEYVEAQKFLRRDIGPLDDQSFVSKIVYANWFYLALAGLAGALIGWAILEPFFNDNDELSIAQLLLFPTVAGAVGLVLGAAEGAICRNFQRAVKNGAVGLAVGFVGAGIALIPVGIVFSLMTAIAVSLQPNLRPNQMPSGMALLVLMMGRAMAWGIIAIPAGIGQGIALRERKVIVNGVVGALLGGLLGGLLFDPISIWFDGGENAVVSRAVGFSVIGIAVGAFIGLVQGWTKTAWLLMQKGPLAGKQFILFRDTTVLGSSPKSDVYLFKDDAIEPRHALVINRGGRFEIEDQNTADGTYVNGIAVNRHVLQAGDQIVLGKTVLQFTLKEQAPA